MRLFSLIGLPVLALALGLGLGVSIERQRALTEYEALDALYSGEASSGATVIGDPEQEVDLGLMWEVWRQLENYYIAPEELQVNNMVFGAVKGMVAGIGDPYTVFMTPDEDKEFISALNGELEGIGAELTLKEGAITVVAPLKNSPAARAGLFPQDIIIKVDDRDVTGMNLDEAVGLIRGEAGTTVVIEIFRPEDLSQHTLTIVRERVHVPAVESEILETGSGSFGYISMNRFDELLPSETDRALRSFMGEDIEGIILDLRFNGGGRLDAAVDVASFFIEEGIVVTIERRGKITETESVSGNPLVADVPLVVIINEGSASASEILAGALQDHGRATIVGMQSFGKGTVQEIIDLPGGSSIRVTTAQWLTPDGHNLGKTGVTPDIEVDRTVQQMQSGDDPQLEAAKKALLGE